MTRQGGELGLVFVAVLLALLIFGPKPHRCHPVIVPQPSPVIVPRPVYPLWPLYPPWWHQPYRPWYSPCHPHHR